MSMRCMLVMRGMRGDILSCYGIATLSPIRHSASTDHNDLPSGGNNDTGRHLSPVSGAADDRDGLVAWHFVEMLVQGILNMSLFPLVIPAHIDHSKIGALRPAFIQRVNIDHFKLLGWQSCGLPGGDAAIHEAMNIIPADADQLHDGLAAALFIFDQDHQGRIVWQ